MSEQLAVDLAMALGRRYNHHPHWQGIAEWMIQLSPDAARDYLAFLQGDWLQAKRLFGDLEDQQ